MQAETRRSGSRLRSLGLPALIVLVTAGLVALLVVTRPQLEPEPAPERVWPVEVIEARHRTYQPTLSLFGEVVAGRRSELRPRVDGLVVEIGEHFHEGGAVAAGELLLRIDPFDYQTTLAERRSLLVEARARLAKLGRDLGRAEELFADDSASEQFLDDARLAVAEQEALVEQREIGVRRAERDLADTRMTAPFAGVLADVNADLGKQVSGMGDAKVAELIDTSALEVRFALSNAQYGRLLEGGEPVRGRSATITWQVGSQQISYAATIERVAAEIAAATGGVDVFAVIDSGGRQLPLRPGAFVSVSLADKRYDGVLTAPDSALYGEETVYVVEEGRMSPRRIEIHGHDGSTMLFTADGDRPIRDGDRIIVTQLREGGAGARVAFR